MSLPSRYLTHLLALTRRFGVDDEDVLQGFSVESDARLTVAQLVPLFERARALTGEPGLGVYLGLAMRATWHGYLGFAVLVARDIGEALALAERFIATVTPALSLRVVPEGAFTSVVIEEHDDFGPSRDFIVPAFALGLVSIAESLASHEVDGQLELAFAEPPWFAPLAAAQPRLRNVTFGRPRHRLRFDSAMLATPFQQADAEAQKLAAEQCERELQALHAAAGFAARVRALLLTPSGVRDVDAVAKALSTSARTLKRRLQSEGTSYTELLEAERRARAELLLTQGTLSVKEVSAQLGYADTAAFSHAFARWNGVSPSEFQRARAANRAITD